MNEENERLIAYRIIKDYLDSKRPLKQIIDKWLPGSMPRIKRNFVYNLAKGTVRHLLFLDHGIAKFSKLDMGKIDQNLLCILRISSYQIMFMEKVPPYSILDQAVRLAKKSAHPKTARFVNGILRNMARKPDLRGWLCAGIEDSGISWEQKLSLKHSYPRWIVDYWSTYYGPAQTEKICVSMNKNPAIFLRFDPGRVSRSSAAGMLGLPQDINLGLPEELRNTNFVTASLKDIAQSSLMEQGAAAVQDLSSQIAVKYYLNPQPGDSVLDLCSAPGGKALFAYELMGKKGYMVSVDINPKKTEKMKRDFKRLGAPDIKVITDDASSLEKLKQETLFDKIFIDAPCSALGTISKNPDVKYNKKKEDIARLGENSLKILSSAGRFLRKGGRLTYYACTLSPVENQQMIERFLKKNTQYSVCGDLFEHGKTKSRGCVEIKPYYFGSEGGFACTLSKK